MCRIVVLYETRWPNFKYDFNLDIRFWYWISKKNPTQHFWFYSRWSLACVISSTGAIVRNYTIRLLVVCQRHYIFGPRTSKHQWSCRCSAYPWFEWWSSLQRSVDHLGSIGEIREVSLWEDVWVCWLMCSWEILTGTNITIRLEGSDDCFRYDAQFLIWDKRDLPLTSEFDFTVNVLD